MLVYQWWLIYVINAFASQRHNAANTGPPPSERSGSVLPCYVPLQTSMYLSSVVFLYNSIFIQPKCYQHSWTRTNNVWFATFCNLLIGSKADSAVGSPNVQTYSKFFSVSWWGQEVKRIMPRITAARSCGSCAVTWLTSGAELTGEVLNSHTLTVQIMKSCTFKNTDFEIITAPWLLLGKKNAQ